MMKKVILALILAMFLVWPVQAQEPDDDYVIYLPLVTNMTTCKETWRIVKPDGMTNYCLNPSAEAAGNYAAEAGTTVTLSTTYSHYGLYSYRVQTDADNEGIELTLSTLSDAIHYVTMRVRGDLPSSWVWSLDDSNWRQPALIESLDANWDLYGVVFSAAQANGSTKLSIHQNGAGSGDFYLDGIQVEDNGYWTMYCDGTQPGCAWNGAADASTSSRSAVARAGGIIQDLWGDYSFFVEEIIGAGAANQDLNTRSYATLPGGELSGAKITERKFTLIGRFVGNSEEDLHQKRQELLKELSLSMYPASQPMRLNFDGAIVQKQIAAYYSGGLEGRLKASYGPFQVEGSDQWIRVNYHTERASIQFLAVDPFWYEIGESSILLDTNDSATFRYVAARLKDTGQWSELGPPDAGGTYTDIRAIVEDDTYVYFGGSFFNFDNDADADNIVRWHKVNQSWSPLDTGINNTVEALAIGPDGTLYAGGRFTTAGGGAANRIASWNGAAWAALGAGLNNDVYALAIGLDGTLYAGGVFTDVQGGPGGTYNRIIAWDGAVYSALDVGLNGAVEALAVGLDDTLYIGGLFTDIQGGPGGTYNRIISWDGTAYSALRTGMNNTVATLIIAEDGTLYAGGNFTTADGNPANRIASWNGTAWTTLGSGATAGTVDALSIGPDSVLHASGAFTIMGGIEVDRIARWNGASWSHVDVNLPGAPATEGLLASQYADPVINRNYDLFVGFSTNGAGYFAGLVAITNSGTTLAYPTIIFHRSGGTSATIKTLRNETTGDELLFDYDLLDGETLTIDLTPTTKSIVSSMFGNRSDAILANSDFGAWSLQPDDNDVTSFVDVSGAPTITAWMLWKDAYSSFD